MKFLRYDDDQIAEYGNITDYHKNKKAHSSIFYKTKKAPMKGWAVPFVTGHKYKIHWGLTGLDFT